jgi:hypothetical protein
MACGLNGHCSPNPGSSLKYKIALKSVILIIHLIGKVGMSRGARQIRPRDLEQLAEAIGQSAECTVKRKRTDERMPNEISRKDRKKSIKSSLDRKKKASQA